MLRLSKVPRKHSNYSKVRRASARLVLLKAREPIDYRALSIAMSSAPLHGSARTRTECLKERALRKDLP